MTYFALIENDGRFVAVECGYPYYTDFIGTAELSYNKERLIEYRKIMHKESEWKLVEVIITLKDAE